MSTFFLVTLYLHNLHIFCKLICKITLRITHSVAASLFLLVQTYVMLGRVPISRPNGILIPYSTMHPLLHFQSFSEFNLIWVSWHVLKCSGWALYWLCIPKWHKISVFLTEAIFWYGNRKIYLVERVCHNFLHRVWYRRSLIFDDFIFTRSPLNNSVIPWNFRSSLSGRVNSECGHDMK